MRFSHIAAVAVPLFSWQVNAEYSIHDSCSSISGLIEKVVDDALPKITRAADELQKNPMNKDIDDLATYLFGTDSDKRSKAAAHMSGLGMIHTRLNHKNIPKVLPRGHIAFYCGKEAAKDHIIKKEKGKEYIIYPEINAGVEMSDAYKNCIGKKNIFDLFVEDETQGLTHTTVSKSAGSSIMICEKPLQDAVKNQYKTRDDITKEIWENIANKPKPGLLKKMASKKPMDALALIDHTIIHELMHTDVAGAALDVDKNGVNSEGAYSWGNCVGNPNGHDNAESLAYFVSGVDAILDHQLRVQKDGWMEKITEAVRRLLRRWIA